MLPERIRPSLFKLAGDPWKREARVCSQRDNRPPRRPPGSCSFPTSAAPDIVTGWEKMPPQAEKLLKLLGKLTFLLY